MEREREKERDGGKEGKRERERRREKENTFNEITFPMEQDWNESESVDLIRRDKRAIVIRVFRT